jgi:hypothetical protein
MLLWCDSQILGWPGSFDRPHIDRTGKSGVDLEPATEDIGNQLAEPSLTLTGGRSPIWSGSREPSCRPDHPGGQAHPGDPDRDVGLAG